jgi:hypothetical protein
LPANLLILLPLNSEPPLQENTLSQKLELCEWGIENRRKRDMEIICNFSPSSSSSSSSSSSLETHKLTYSWGKGLGLFEEKG